jgi:radical SAM protein with 4Fe4S-binding SPASM domain
MNNLQSVEETSRLDTIHFNSTKSCNLGCSFCYDKAIRGRTENLSIEIIRNLAKEAAELGARRVILSGGEPMVRTDWREVARVFDEAGMEVSLATNGTLITEEVATFLASLSKVSLSISIDGDEKIHDQLREQQGAHRRTMRGFEALRQAGVAFDVNATIFRDNISEVPFLTRLARDFDCDVRLSLLHPNGRGEIMAGQALEPEEILRLREYCHIMRQHGVKIFLNLPPLLQYLDEIIPTRGAACGWAINFCGVLANGDVSICGVASDEPDLVAGNIKEKSFKEIWMTAPLFRQTRSLDVHDLGGICGRCAFNEFCGGACRLSAFKAEGDFLAPYELCQHFYDQGYIPEEILDPPTERKASEAGKVGTRVNRSLRVLASR